MRTVMTSALVMMVAGVPGKRRWEGVGGGAGVAGAEAGAERGEQGLGQDAERDVEAGVEVDGGGERVGAECLGDLGEALPGGHAAGVLPDQGPGGDVVVGDDYGGGGAGLGR